MRKVHAQQVAGNQEGQAVLEYILMLMMALGVVTTIGLGFKKSLFSIWSSLDQEISAPCPHDCVPDPAVKRGIR